MKKFNKRIILVLIMMVMLFSTLQLKFGSEKVNRVAGLEKHYKTGAIPVLSTTATVKSLTLPSTAKSVSSCSAILLVKAYGSLNATDDGYLRYETYYRPTTDSAYSSSNYVSVSSSITSRTDSGDCLVSLKSGTAYMSAYVPVAVEYGTSSQARKKMEYVGYDTGQVGAPAYVLLTVSWVDFSGTSQSSEFGFEVIWK